MTFRIFSVVSSLFLVSNLVTSSKDESCGVYLAPSTIPGSGLGMFVGHRSLEKGGLVTLEDVVIPIIEMEWNNRLAPGPRVFLWDEYTWNPDVFPGMDEEVDEIELMNVASPGVGAAANSFLSLVNVIDDYVTMNRVVEGDSPGVGAFTPYYGRSFRATKDLSPGAEIFVEYVYPPNMRA